MAEDRYDDLVRDLTVLGRAIDPPASPERLTTAVMDRVAALPPPVPNGERAPASSHAAWWRASSRDAAASRSLSPPS